MQLFEQLFVLEVECHRMLRTQGNPENPHQIA